MDWQAYLAKARNNLHTAQQAYAQRDYDSCASRAYFAVFHGEIAALIKLTAFRQDRWGHDRVQEEFNRRLIRTRKVFPAALRSIHNDLIGRRHVADYTDQHTSARIAEHCLRQAAEMLTAILVLHHSEFDGRVVNRVKSGQPIHRRTTSDAQEKISCHA